MQRKSGDPEGNDKLAITPEMIEAGVRAFFDFDPRFESERAAVEKIYRAMRNVEPRG